MNYKKLIDKNKIVFSPIIAKQYLDTIVLFFNTFDGVGAKFDFLRLIDEEALFPYFDSCGIPHRFIIPYKLEMKSRLLNEYEMNALVGKILTFNETGDNYIVSHFIDGKTPKVYIAGLGSYDAGMLESQFNINGKPILKGI